MKFDYASLPVEYRAYLLGLPNTAYNSNGNKRDAYNGNGNSNSYNKCGRPRALTFLQRVRIGQAWHEALNRHAVTVRNRSRDRAMARLQATFRRLCAEHAAPHKIVAVRAEMDRIGRVGAVLVKPPEIDRPVIDAAIAELFGVSPRMVRSIRSDKRLLPFMPGAVWLEPDWEREERRGWEARRLARQLMTAARFAKREPVRFWEGGLQVPFKVGTEWEIIQGAAPPGMRCTFFEPTRRQPTDREARARRAMRAWADKVAAWKREGELLSTNGRIGSIW